MKRLLKTYSTVATNTFDDMVYIAALNIEDGLLTGGAQPGIDYQMIDLYRLGMPFAMKLYEQNLDPSHTVSYPSGHPCA